MPFWRRAGRRVESDHLDTHEEATMKLDGAYLVRLDEKTHALESLGQMNVGIVWLSANATVEGKGILDSMLLSPRVTAYFDNDGASKSTVSCMLFPQDGPPAGIAGPVVIACWDAKSAAEAAVLTAHFLSVSLPPSSGEPFIHATWPTLQ